MMAALLSRIRLWSAIVDPPPSRRCVGLYGRFIFAVSTDRQSCLGKDSFQSGLVVNQQIARA